MQGFPPPPNPYAPPRAQDASAAAAGAVLPPGQLRIDGAWGLAWERMKRFLFVPFDFGKWFAFAFIVWLAELGESGGNNFNFNQFRSLGRGGPFGGGGGGGGGGDAELREMMERFEEWVQDNLGAIIAISVAVLVVALALTALFMWLSSRGHMMSLRALALDHARVGEHWRETRAAAWSYFGFRMLLGAIGLPIGLGVTVWLLWGVVDALAGGLHDPMDLVRALLAPILVLVAFSLLMAPIHFLGRNVLAPILLKTGGGLRAAWTCTMNVVRTSFGGLFLFLLVRMGIAIVQGVAEWIVTLVTCCISWIPLLAEFICAFVLAPIHAFELGYTLHVIESLGPEYKLTVDPPPWQPPYPPYGQYPGYAPYPQYPQQYPPYPPPGYPPYPPR